MEIILYGDNPLLQHSIGLPQSTLLAIGRVSATSLGMAAEEDVAVEEEDASESVKH